MKYYLVSDDADTCTGLRLAGVYFHLATTPALAEKALKEVLNDDNAGILMITGNIRKFCPETVAEIEKGSKPVLVEVPDSKNDAGTTDSVSDYIKATVGISI